MPRYFYLLICCLPLLSGCIELLAVSAVTAMVKDERTTGHFIEDEAIEIKAMQQLREDEEIYSLAHINVTSYNTIVLVTGEAPTEDLRIRIIDIVRAIENVSYVYDEMQTAVPTSLVARSADTLITAHVKTELLADKTIDGLKIKVVTEAGVVYLMGFVTEAEAYTAGEIARHISGVQKVVKLFQYVQETKDTENRQPVRLPYG